MSVGVNFASRPSGVAPPAAPLWGSLPVLLSQRLDGLSRELIDAGLHVLEDVLVSISDDELVLEDFDLGPDGKVLGAGVERARREGSDHVTK